MTLLVQLVLDEGEGAELIGLLAKALARHELGLLDVRMQPGEPAPMRASKPAPKLAHAPNKRAYQLRGRRGHPATGGGRFAALRPHLEKGPLHLADIRQIFRQHKPPFATNGLSSAVAAWIKYGLIEKVGTGRYKLKGAHEHET